MAEQVRTFLSVYLTKKSSKKISTLVIFEINKSKEFMKFGTWESETRETIW